MSRKVQILVLIILLNALVPIFHLNTVMANGKHEEQTIFRGFIQASGLGDNLKKRFKLTYSDHILIDDGYQYFLESEIDFSRYVGRFCELKGTIFHENQWTFGLKILMVKEITIIDFEPNHLDTDSLKEKRAKYFSEEYHKSTTDTLKGHIVRSTRTAPDIKNDYTILIDEPVEYLGSQSSDQPKSTHQIAVNHLDLTMMYNFEKYVAENKRIRIIGYLHSGHNHSLTFSALEIIE